MNKKKITGILLTLVLVFSADAFASDELGKAMEEKINNFPEDILEYIDDYVCGVIGMRFDVIVNINDANHIGEIAEYITDATRDVIGESNYSAVDVMISCNNGDDDLLSWHSTDLESGYLYSSSDDYPNPVPNVTISDLYDLNTKTPLPNAIDYSEKITELEARIEALESLLYSSDTIEKTTQNAGDDIILDSGTWIVGEDISPNKYDIECIDGNGSIKFYESYSTRKEKNYNYFEVYYMAASDNIMADHNIQTAHNIMLQKGNCIYIDSMSVKFIPKSVG